MTEHLDKALEDLKLPDHPARLFDPIRYTLNAGGKRFRPYLTMLGCELAGGDPMRAIPAAVSVELLHNFTLIHDDIMDDAETRRGQQSVYKKWGTNDAILSGDYMFALAIEQLDRYRNDHELDKERFGLLYHTLLTGVRTVCEGQSRDMEFEKRHDVDIQQYLQMIGQKTAALLKTSIELGTLVANAESQLTLNAGDMAYQAGLAFQIQDDVLDATADAEKFGKKIGGDIREQKKTCLYVIASQRLNEQGRKELAEIYEQNQVSEEQVQNVINIFHETGAIREARNLLESYYRNSIERLEEFDKIEAREKIKTLLDQLRNREK